ncbi:MAG: response regulator [Spirochaetales bacterium]|nr:response regulator [Spirochaetales bacterium]
MDVDQKIRILVVDDNAMFRQVLIDFLGSQGDMEVIGEACDGEEAVRKVIELRPEVVTMDVRMPVMNGLTALRAFKALPSSPKVIILTGFDTIEYREAARVAGASDFVGKAAIAKDLVPAIKEKSKNGEPYGDD